MAEYIDKSEIYRRYFNGGCGVVRMHVSDIDVIPAADVAPVVHGRWEENELGYTCSACNKLHITGTSIRTLKFKFCPYCGANMDKEEPNGR